MTRFNLVGTAGERGARVLPCRIESCTPEGADILCHFEAQTEFLQSIELARSRAADFLEFLGVASQAGALRNRAFDFHVDDPFFAGSLEQASYGLSLAAAFVCESLGVECVNDIFVATGVLSRDTPNDVCPVDGSSLRQKIEACRTAGFHLLCPPGQSAHEEYATSLSAENSFVSAICLLGGTSLLQAIAERLPDDRPACQMLAVYCRAHVEVMQFPHDLSALQPLCHRLTRCDDPDTRLSALLSLAGLSRITKLPSESERILYCIVETSAEEREFDRALARVLEDVFQLGVDESRQDAFHVVAYLLHAVATLYADQRFLDRLSPVGEFFRKILDRADPSQSGQPEMLVVWVLQDCGVRFDLSDVNGLLARIANLREQPVFHELLVRHDGDGALAGIDYKLALEDPFQLFDLNRAYENSSSGATVIDLNRYAVKIRWIDGAGVFPPSIDTLHFLGDISRPLADSSVRNVVDVGAGTGVLGIVAAKSNPNVESVDFIDTYPLTSDVCCNNIQVNWPKHRKHERAAGDEQSQPPQFSESPWFDAEDRGRTIAMRFHAAPAESVLMTLVAAQPTGRFSLAIAAPPYVPIHEPLPITLWQATSGTGLLRWLVENGGHFTDRLLISFGEIAKREFDAALDTAKDQWEVPYKALGRHVVAFRIPRLIDLLEREDRYPGWRERLLEGPLSSVCRTDDEDEFREWRKSAPEEFQDWYENRRGSAETIPHFLHVTTSYLLTYK